MPGYVLQKGFSMEYALERLRVQCAELLAATGLVKADAVTLTDPKPNIPADLAFPCFQAARAAGINNPAEFAAKLAGAVQIPADALIGKVEAAGPFVNISVNPSNFTTDVLSEVLKLGEDYGKEIAAQDKHLLSTFLRPILPAKCT